MIEEGKSLSISNCYVTGNITKIGSETTALITGGIIGELSHSSYISSTIIRNCLVVVLQLEGNTVHRIGKLTDRDEYLKKMLYNNYGYVKNKLSGWSNVADWKLNGADWNGLMSSEPLKSWDKEIWKIYTTGSNADKYLPQLLGYGSGQLLIPNPFNNTSTNYTVIFSPGNGTTVSSQIVAANSTLTEPTVPVKAGYIFKGWYSDPYYMNKWVFGSKGTAVTSDIILYALWIHEGSALIDIPETEGVEFEFGKYEGEIGLFVIIDIVLLGDYNKSNVWLNVNGDRIDPISRITGTVTILTFEVEIRTTDVLILIKGVERNDGTDIQSPEDNTKIYAISGSLYVESSKAGDLLVYTINGQLFLNNKISEGTTTIPLPKGIYIVRYNNIVKKVIVTTK